MVPREIVVMKAAQGQASLDFITAYGWLIILVLISGLGLAAVL